MSVTDSWLNNEKYDHAEEKFINAVLDRSEGELVMNGLIADAAWDAGFEAGVLASEAGVGRADE